MEQLSDKITEQQEIIESLVERQREMEKKQLRFLAVLSDYEKDWS